MIKNISMLKYTKLLLLIAHFYEYFIYFCFLVTIINFKTTIQIQAKIIIIACIESKLSLNYLY